MNDKPIKGMRDKRFWQNLNKEERSQLMYIQMGYSGSGYGAGGYLPDDCSECDSCGQPILGTGWCDSCYNTWQRLFNKGCGK
jgi:hypothetical protein